MSEAQQRRTLEEWLENYSGLISKVIRAYAFNGPDREDLFQEIAVQLWDSIPRFREEAAVTTWIYRVAFYAAIAWSKRERKHSERVREMVHQPLVEETEEDPRLTWLYSQIASLDAIDRSLLLLLLDGLSYREMAETLGISEQNVGVKIHRIKRDLAERSSRQGGPHGV